MSDQSKTDMVMKFTLKSGKDVNAECALDIDAGDTFMEGFTPATYQDYSNFFEVLDFDLGMAVKEDDENVSTLSQPHRSAAGNGQASRVAGQFARWRSATDDDIKRGKIKYPVEFDKFSFSRLIDSASPIFFQYCCNSTSFKSAVLVKRVSQGISRPALGYLRFEFQDVLIIGVNWDDGDVVKESCTFICKDLVVKYKPQQAKGTLDPKGVAPAHWNQSDAGSAGGGTG
jgi:type VI protein secretion system component Hcp